VTEYKYTRAYDLDGTLLNNGNGENALRRLLWLPKPGRDRREVRLVITGRQGGHIKAGLVKWALKLIGYWNVEEVVMNPLPTSAPEDIIDFKVRVLRDHGVREYIDDDEETRYQVGSLWHGWEGVCRGRRR